jgi:hypothetical protein
MIKNSKLRRQRKRLWALRRLRERRDRWEPGPSNEPFPGEYEIRVLEERTGDYEEDAE